MSQKTTVYVAGFLHDHRNVLLIRKLKPAWQVNKLNGVGGKVEEGETPQQAMRREFMEEAGLDIPAWKPRAILMGDGYKVHFFSAVGDPNTAVRKTDEILEVHPMDNLPHDVIPNLRWLIPLSLDESVDVASVVDSGK